MWEVLGCVNPRECECVGVCAQVCVQLSIRLLKRINAVAWCQLRVDRGNETLHIIEQFGAVACGANVAYVIRWCHHHLLQHHNVVQLPLHLVVPKMLSEELE